MEIFLPRLARAWSEQTELRIVRGRDRNFFFGLACGAAEESVTSVSLLFGFREDGLRAADHVERQAGEAGDLDAVAAVGGRLRR